MRENQSGTSGSAGRARRRGAAGTAGPIAAAAAGTTRRAGVAAAGRSPSAAAAAGGWRSGTGTVERAVERVVKRNDFADTEAFDHFGVRIVGGADDHRATLEFVFILHADEAFAVISEKRGQRHGQD